MARSTATNPGKHPDSYFGLVRKFPLRPIRSDAELDQAIRVIDGLLDKENHSSLDSGEQDYLDVLGDLVERYETKTNPIPPPTDAEMLSHLIEAKGVTQATVARETGIAASTISAVLPGKRTLTRGHLAKLADYFHVDPGVFGPNARTAG
jgi:HTH-type transcriptional regulator/antitoxin HigA